MKIGFICPNIPGHINPMTALARHLQERNHEVVFLYSASAHGLPCVPGDKNDDMNANRPEMSKLEGPGAIEFYCGVAAKETEVIFKSLPKMVDTTGVEALILDPVQFFVEFTGFTHTKGIKAYAKEAGLKIDWDIPSGVFSRLAYITQVPREFDFENPLLPPQFHHTGSVS